MIRILVVVGLIVLAWYFIAPRILGDPQLTKARRLLGVRSDAGRDEILTAHRRLMVRVHPDAGGTSGLAAELNAARDLLLRQLELKRPRGD